MKFPAAFGPRGPADPAYASLDGAAPPKLTTPLASATPTANTRTAMTASQAVGIPPDELGVGVGPRRATRSVAGRSPPPWAARRFFDERGLGRLGSGLKWQPPGRR